MFVVYDNNGDLVTFTKDKDKAIRLAMKYYGKYKNIR